MLKTDPFTPTSLRSFLLFVTGPFLCVAVASAQEYEDPHGGPQHFVSAPSAQARFSAATARMALSTLPDAPDAVASMAKTSTTGTIFLSSFRADADQHATPPMSGPYDKYILPGQAVPVLTARDKVILGVRDAFSPYSLVAWVTSAGYEHFTNQSPNYGRNGRAYAQRLGASAVRDVSAGLFSDSILAPLLHEDPRYYKLGRGQNVGRRLIHAGSHPFVTQTDSGRRTINFANLGGKLGTSTLNNAYYPRNNRGVTETVKGFGGSLVGSAVSFAVSEFLSDALEVIFSK